MRFEWNEDKGRRNLLKHRVRFETATLAFDDPNAVTQHDELSEEGERWITLGTVARGVILVVVHAFFEADSEDVTRIISARIAESRERRIYEEANQGAKTRYRRPRGHERRRH